jgi:hypothetical protein
MVGASLDGIREEPQGVERRRPLDGLRGWRAIRGSLPQALDPVNHRDDGSRFDPKCVTPRADPSPGR